MKNAAPQTNHSSCSLIAVCLAIAWSAVTPPAQAADLNRLAAVPERAFSKVIRSGLRVDDLASDDRMRAETFVYPQISLGPRHSLVFVEQTRTDRGTRGKPDRNLPGVRVVEIRFGDGDSVASKELFKRTGEQAIARGVTAHPAVSRLTLNYYDIEQSLSGEDVVVGYDPVESGFVRGADSGDANAAVTQWTVVREGDGELQISGAQGEVGREYRIRVDENQRFEVTGSIVAAIGAEWSHRAELWVPLRLSNEGERSKMRAALQMKASEEPKVASVGGMVFIPFPVPVDGRGNATLDLHDTAGIAIDMENLELNFLSKLIDRLIDDVRRLDKETSMGIGNDTQLERFAKADADLTLARLFAQLQTENLKGRKVLDGIADTEAGLATLVFQFPYEFDGANYAVSYSPGSDRVFLTAAAPRWSTGEQRALQFEAPNGKLVYAMRLTETDPVALTGEQKNALCSKMAESFGLVDLKNASVVTGAPPGRLDVEVADDGSGASDIGSLGLLSAGIDRSGRMILNISAASGDDSFRLVDLYLRKSGLPVSIDVRKALTRPDAVLAVGMKPEPVRVGGTIKSEQGFDIVTEAKKTTIITVMVDEGVFAKLDRDIVTVSLCYPDERIERYSVEVGRDVGEADVEVAVRTSGGKVEGGINYSLDGERWELDEEGLYGLVYIED